MSYLNTIAGPTTCPRCGRDDMKSPAARNALSRKDNKTHVCSSCGTDEAMMVFFGNGDSWPGFPGVTTHFATTTPEELS